MSTIIFTTISSISRSCPSIDCFHRSQHFSLSTRINRHCQAEWIGAITHSYLHSLYRDHTLLFNPSFFYQLSVETPQMVWNGYLLIMTISITPCHYLLTSQFHRGPSFSPDHPVTLDPGESSPSAFPEWGWGTIWVPSNCVMLINFLEVRTAICKYIGETESQEGFCIGQRVFGERHNVHWGSAHHPRDFEMRFEKKRARGTCKNKRSTWKKALEEPLRLGMKQ